MLNTFCVFAANELHGAAAPVWLPNFGLIYWSKTSFAIAGAIFFIRLKEIFKQKNNFLSLSIVILILYSIPGFNFILALPLNILFSGVATLKNQGITFQSRIPTQIVWSIPALVLTIDLVYKIFGAKNRHA
ncbi:MAG TPA: hypothetical protein VMD52_07235 [Patescibacteria group bacterium]|nr:hypothetical protein [Patescibacteria group bacterium]